MIRKKLETDTTLTTASGCTFTAEKGWFVRQHDTMIVLEEPDHELKVVLIENQEMSAQDAVNSAWKQVQPDFDYPIKHTMEQTPQDGWDKIVQFMYDTPTSLVIFATSRKAGTTWYVELINGTRASFDRRMAGVLVISTSFKVPGAQEESFAGKKAHALDATKLKAFITFVQESMLQCKVPGAAIAVVQNGNVILEEGFGVRELGKQETATPKTLFMIGSTTKALTTFMMASLVDEGKFAWNTPVKEVMSVFELGDEATTNQLLMKHMVSASTGMPRQDIEFFFNYDQATPKSRITEMRNMKPTTGFGETFQYSNSMVSAAGYIAAHSIDKNSELGKAYDIAMQSHVFDPVDMISTTFDTNKVKSVNHAIPHGQDLKGNPVPLILHDEQSVTSVRPAGGAWSNAHDIAQYMIVELNKGINAKGKRIVSEQNLLKRRESQVKITDKLSYGLGLMTEDNHGTLTVGHDGMTLGFHSLMFFLPEHNVGLVVLTNTRGAMTFTLAVKRKFIELLFDGKALSSDMIKMGVEQQEAMLAKNLEDIIFKPDASWLKQFVGTYTHPVLGQVIVRKTSDGAEFDARVWKSAIGQKHQKDGDRLILTNGTFAGLEFFPQQNDGKLQLVLESGQHQYVFERINQ